MKYFIGVCAILALIVGFTQIPGTFAPAHADKFDGECTGQETDGRCADKCPDGQYLQGYDKDTGAAVCSDPPTGCPYAERVPLGPECDKLAPQSANSDNLPTQSTQDSNSDPSFTGK